MPPRTASARMQAVSWPAPTGTSAGRRRGSVDREAAARREAAAGRDRARVGRCARDAGQPRARAPLRQRAQQPERVGVRRAAEDRVDRAGLHDPPGIQHRHPVAGAGHHAEIVGHEHHAHRQLVLQPQQQLEDLVLDRDVERRGRLVGQQQLRPAGQGDGDHRALAHAAGELVRVVGQPPPRVRDADQVQQLGRPAAAPPAQAEMHAEDSVICSPIGSTGLSAVIGSWNTIAISPPAHRAHRRSGRPADRVPATHLRRSCLPRRQQAQDRAQVRLLPEPDSPTMPSISPGATSRSTPSTGAAPGRCVTDSRADS